MRDVPPDEFVKLYQAPVFYERRFEYQGRMGDYHVLVEMVNNGTSFFRPAARIRTPVAALPEDWPHQPRPSDPARWLPPAEGPENSED
jgi:hypothetical protein